MASTLRAFILCMMIVALAYLPEESTEAASVSRRKREPTHLTNIQVAVDGNKPIAIVGDQFVCATLDWWPASKCNYGTCPWHSASILNLDLENPILVEAVKALAPLRLRLGGTLQDTIVYDIGSPVEPCLPLVARLVVNSSNSFEFSRGCLSKQRWDDLNQFFKETGVSVAFGLNVLYGRPSYETWNPSNAAELIRYSHDQGYPVTAWELGNERMGVAGASVQISPRIYAENVMKLRTIVNDVYQNVSRKPLVVAPDGFYEVGNPEYEVFLTQSGPNVVDVVTRHFYNLGPGTTAAFLDTQSSFPFPEGRLSIIYGLLSTEELVNRIRDPDYTNAEERNYAGLQTVLREYPWATAWVGESGGAYNSGHGNVTDAFIMAFWYLNQMGLASKHNNQAFCRQTLIGGHYGLLDAVTLVPNPDFYGALLWQKLMGNNVLSVRVKSTDIRAYAHCQKNSTEGGVTVLLLNFSNVTSYSVDVSVLGHSEFSGAARVKRKLAQDSDAFQGQQNVHAAVPRLEYLMSPAEGDILSHAVLLNGKRLSLTPSGGLPILEARTVDSSTPTTLDPLTYAFVVLTDASAGACLIG